MGRLIPCLASPLALLLLGAGLTGCYKPKILDGGLKCRPDGGAKSCPEGFKCEPVTQTCWKNLDGGDNGDVADVDAIDGMDAPGDADGPICVEPKPNCTEAPGLCDPLCRTGCMCGEKCTVAPSGALACRTWRTTGFPRTLLQPCDIDFEGSAMQTDNCAPGLTCLRDGCTWRCFQFCRADADCTNASCTRDVGGGNKVCDVPFVDGCTPLPSVGNTGCSGTNMGCYLFSASPTRTVCDCPLNAVGANGDCDRSRDCFPGLACVDRQDGSHAKCLQVCRLANRGTDCPTGTPGSCHDYFGIPPGSQSHATFGYCF